MGRNTLNRRHMLSGAVASACVMPAKAKALLETPTDGTFEILDLSEEVLDFDPDRTEDGACHAPFRVAFLEWSEETSNNRLRA